jgi:integrase
MTYSYVDRIRDGKIVLYRRNDSPILHARIKLDGVKGYIVRSTKSKNIADAARKAEDLYDDLRYKVRNGLTVRPYTFESFYDEWFKSTKNTLSSHRVKYISGTAKRYFLPFFGEMNLEDINNYTVEHYWSWRINYWSSDEAKSKIYNSKKKRSSNKRAYSQKLGNFAQTPSRKTLQMEQSLLRQIFRWAIRMGISNRPLEINAPKIGSRHQINRRPAFTLPEWQKLYRYLRHWVDEKPSSSERREAPAADDAEQIGRKKPHGLHRFQRQMLRHYVLFMAMSGLRPNEARQLRWKDFSIHVDSSGKEHLVIHVSPTTKTGKRDCIPLRATKRILERLKTLSPNTDQDGYVFCDVKGNPIDNFGKTFKKILIDSGLLEDNHGNVRTIYSLRHTYATFRLLYGNARMDDLALNMGTSPTMLYKHYSHVTVYNRAEELGGSLHEEKSRSGLYF